MPPLKHASTLERKHDFSHGGTLADMTYGERLDEALKLPGKERKDLARHLDVSVQSIGQIISGKTVAATAENCAKTARFLRVDFYWLATGEGEPRPRPALSPMAFELGRCFDSTVPMHLRNAVYAKLTGDIEFANAVQPAASQIPALPSTAPRRS